MNTSVYQRFEQSIRWNALEAGLYHGLLLAHQIALFFVVPPALYGLVGTIFSLMYLCITITNGGLDMTLPAFFPSLVTSRYQFRHAIGKQVAPEIALLVVGALFGIWYNPVGDLLYPTLALGLGCLLITEGLRKTARALLQLAFLNKILMIIEICALFFYILAIWSWVILGTPLTLAHIFFPMLLSSCIALGAKLAVISRWYLQLPATNESSLITTQQIITHRFFNYITQLGHTLFSSNFLVPLFAARFGMASAALFKIMSWIVQVLSLCFKKIFGIPGTALLAHIRTAPLATQQHAFSLIARRVHYWLCMMFVPCMLIPYALIMTYPAAFLGISYATLIAYIVLTLSEHFFMTYETFFITQEKPAYLCLFTCCSLGLLAAILHATRFSSSFIVLSGIFVVRFFSFVLISSFSFYLWRLVPAWKMKTRSAELE